MCSFIKGLEAKDMARAQLGLAHSYSRAKVKFNVNKADNMIIQVGGWWVLRCVGGWVRQVAGGGRAGCGRRAERDNRRYAQGRQAAGRWRAAAGNVQERGAQEKTEGNERVVNGSQFTVQGKLQLWRRSSGAQSGLAGSPPPPASTPLLTAVPLPALPRPALARSPPARPCMQLALLIKDKGSLSEESVPALQEIVGEEDKAKEIVEVRCWLICTHVWYAARRGCPSRSKGRLAVQHQGACACSRHRPQPWGSLPLSLLPPAHCCNLPHCNAFPPHPTPPPLQPSRLPR